MSDRFNLIYIALVVYAIIFAAIAYLVYADEKHIDKNIDNINNNRKAINNNTKLLHDKIIPELNNSGITTHK
jgi:uncharacterized protein YoxC